MKLAELHKLIANIEAKYKEDEAVTRDAEGKARTLRTRLDHDRKILDTWKAHATALKEVGEFN